MQFRFARPRNRRRGCRRDRFARHLKLTGRAPSGKHVGGATHHFVLLGGGHDQPVSGSELAETGQHIGGSGDRRKGRRFVESSPSTDYGPAGERPMKVGEQDGAGRVRNGVQAVQGKRQVLHCRGRRHDLTLSGHCLGRRGPGRLTVAAQHQEPPPPAGGSPVGRPAVRRRNGWIGVPGFRTGDGRRAGGPETRCVGTHGHRF